MTNPTIDQRFETCAAATTTIWGHGYRACTTPAEKSAWIARYLAHLAQQHKLWHGDRAA
ncbi:MAG: hypothetical protein M3143_09440 [Actinomycetota bacterium]|nr:hypothetical protein [Actinomycetota bacterium]